MEQTVLTINTCDLIADYLIQISDNISYLTGSAKFPPRKQFKELPEELYECILKEISDVFSLSKYKPDYEHIRVYYSDFGEVKRHQDISLHGRSTHTCLIYLTDNFVGGNLYLELKHGIVKILPEKGKAVIFNKQTYHWTDCQIDGTKLILVIDLLQLF